MRTGWLIFALAAMVTGYGCAHLNVETKAASTPTAPAATAAPARVDFPTQIKPILQAKCQPCHFRGGKVYAQMPFDRPETIKTLGTKLFTRIKDENERRLIRDFLAQN